MAPKKVTAAAAAPAQRKPAPAKTTYLVAYNFVSAVLWATVLGRVVAVYAMRGPAAVHLFTGDFARWTQTLAGMEVLHALFGIVRSPVFTTFVQVLSRFILVWGVVYPFPQLAASPFYSSMLLAWSLTEVIRYTYFAVSLSGASSPAGFTWLRYSTFIVLYPVGILSECAMIWLAAEGPAAALHELGPWVLRAVLVFYIPGSYIMYTHMMKQRRKVLARQKTE